MIKNKENIFYIGGFIHFFQIWCFFILHQSSRKVGTGIAIRYVVGLPISQKKAKHFECLAEITSRREKRKFQVPSPNLLPPAFESPS